MNTESTTLTGAARAAASAFLIAIAPLAAGLGTPTPAVAQGLLSQRVVQAEILPGWQTERGTRIAALHLRMEPGWHTYWRVPGEAGIAPRLDWSGSQNVAAVAPIWPRPQVFVQNGLQSFVYENDLILPLEITPANPNRPIALIGDLAIGVCRDTCVPVDLTVQAALRGTGERDGRILSAMAAAAEPAARAGLTRTTCRVAPERRGAALTLRATLPRTGRDEHIVVELPGTGLWISDTRTWREGTDLVAEARVRAPGGGAVGIDRSSLAITVLSESRMVTSQGCVGG
ncbi:MAG: protein-disulfide reductase DsbD family protein [Pararhodobacter sp.]